RLGAPRVTQVHRIERGADSVHDRTKFPDHARIPGRLTAPRSNNLPDRSRSLHERRGDNLLRCLRTEVPPSLRRGGRRAIRMTADVRTAAVVLVMMTPFHASMVGADRRRDESEIRQLQARQQDAWNRHDAAAYAALFTDDGDVVNVVGWWWKG